MHHGEVKRDAKFENEQGAYNNDLENKKGVEGAKNIMSNKNTPVEKGEEDKSSDMIKIAMALTRCGWQMACDHILLQFKDREIPDWFGNILLDMMDKEKKRQFDWVKLREEMEKMDRPLNAKI